MPITNVTKIEVSARDETLLVTSDEGATVFWYQRNTPDTHLIAEFSGDDRLTYSRMANYDQYKAESENWRTIYEV